MYIARKDTYKIKDRLKKAGCKWNSKYKVWIFPSEEATKGFDFEVVESLAVLEVPKEKPIFKPFKPSCITLNGVITNQTWLRGEGKKEINQFTVMGIGECEGKYYMFSHSPYKFSQGEVLENVACKVEHNYGDKFYILKGFLEF